MDFRLPCEITALRFDVRDRGLERRQGFIGIPLFFEAFRKQGIPHTQGQPCPHPSPLGQTVAPESFDAIGCALPRYPSVVPDIAHRSPRAVPRRPLFRCDRQMRFGPRGDQLGFPPQDPEPRTPQQSEAQAERMSHRLGTRRPAFRFAQLRAELRMEIATLRAEIAGVRRRLAAPVIATVGRVERSATRRRGTGFGGLHPPYASPSSRRGGYWSAAATKRVGSRPLTSQGFALDIPHCSAPTRPMWHGVMLPAPDRGSRR
jgi:hypothetical protein